VVVVVVVWCRRRWRSWCIVALHQRHPIRIRIVSHSSCYFCLFNPDPLQIHGQLGRSRRGRRGPKVDGGAVRPMDFRQQATIWEEGKEEEEEGLSRNNNNNNNTIVTMIIIIVIVITIILIVINP